MGEIESLEEEEEEENSNASSRQPWTVASLGCWMEASRFPTYLSLSIIVEKLDLEVFL